MGDLNLLKIIETPQFTSDFQAQLAAGQDPAPFKTVVEHLEQKLPLPVYHLDNPLVGTHGRWSCLISFDWWMVYKVDIQAGIITLEQTGSHKYLFD